MTERPTGEEIAAWVAKQLAAAPERSEAWAEQVLATYLGEETQVPSVAA